MLDAGGTRNAVSKFFMDSARPATARSFGPAFCRPGRGRAVRGTPQSTVQCGARVRTGRIILGMPAHPAKGGCLGKGVRGKASQAHEGTIGVVLPQVSLPSVDAAADSCDLNFCRRGQLGPKPFTLFLTKCLHDLEAAATPLSVVEAASALGERRYSARAELSFSGFTGHRASASAASTCPNKDTWDSPAPIITAAFMPQRRSRHCIVRHVTEFQAWSRSNLRSSFVHNAAKRFPSCVVRDSLLRSAWS